MVKNLPAKPDIQLQSLGWENSLEKEMATHPSILAWEIPQTEVALRSAVHGGHKRVRHALVTKQQQQY